MPRTEVREVEHGITVSAPAGDVYRLIAEVENWPRIFPPTIYADYAEPGAAEQRIRIWATANGEAKSWTSRRVLDAGALRIDFRQEVSAPPVATMGGTWLIEPATETTSRIRLLHDYRATEERHLEWIDQAVDRNSRSELAALKTNVELAVAEEGLTFSFEDTIQVAGAARDAYDFINDAGKWAERLPHVASVRFSEDTQGLQSLEMDTRVKDGSTHTTKSYRVCFPHHKIAYKQVTLPALMTLHTGYWTFREAGGGTAASSQHTVTVNTGNITKILGEGATLADARDYIHGALSANSRATLGLAKAYAESMR